MSCKDFLAASPDHACAPIQAQGRCKDYWCESGLLVQLALVHPSRRASDRMMRKKAVYDATSLDCLCRSLRRYWLVHKTELCT